MGKEAKSSASSGTRKKHARKAGGDQPVLPLPGVKKAKAKKGEKALPKVKQYIPPTRPAPVQIDPLDSLGLASQLDKELVVILRRLAKKDAVTRTKAIEELRAWVDRDDTFGAESMVPVWLHHFPSLSLHPSRRLRILSASLHDYFLGIPDLRDAVIYHIRHVASTTQREVILAAWCLSTNDVDRSVCREANRSWSRVIQWKKTPVPNEATNEDTSLNAILYLEDDGFSEALASSLCRALLETESFFVEVFPSATVDTAPAPMIVHGKRVKAGHISTQSSTPKEEEEMQTRRAGDLEEEMEEDRNARIRTAALGALRWIIASYSKAVQEGSLLTTVIDQLFSDSRSFIALSPWPSPEGALGAGQPLVRRAAWSLVGSMAQSIMKDASMRHPDAQEKIASIILTSAWTEPDPTVRAVMWEPLLTYLRSVPNAWQDAASYTSHIDSEDDEVNPDDEGDAEDELDAKIDTSQDSISPSQILPTQHPHVYKTFLRFLELGCGGSPVQGYPTLVVILSTIPHSILALTESDLTHLFASIWAAYDGKALSRSLERERRESTAAFINAMVECIGVYARRLYTSIASPTLSSPEGDQPTSETTAGESGGVEARTTLARDLVQNQWSRLWHEALSGGFRLPEHVVGSSFGKALARLHSVDPTLFDIAWTPISSLSASTSSSTQINAILLLSSISARFESDLQSDVTALAAKWMLEATHSPVFDTTPLNLDGIGRVVDDIILLLQYFSNNIAQNSELSEGLISTMKKRLLIFIQTLPPRKLISLISVFISTQPTSAQSTWDNLLISLASQLESSNVDVSSAAGRVLASLAADASLPFGLEANDALGALLKASMAECLKNPEEEKVGLVSALLSRKGHLITPDAYESCRDQLEDHLAQSLPSFLRNEDISMSLPNASIPLISPFSSDLATNPACSSCVGALFIFAHLDGKSDAALRLWETWTKTSTTEAKEAARTYIVQLLKTSLADSDSRLSPEQILDLVLLTPDLRTGIQDSVLPSQTTFDTQLDVLRLYAPHPALSVIDPVIPVSTAPPSSSVPPNFDGRGLSASARTRIALSRVIASDRRMIKDSIWAIQHLLILEIMARDRLAMSGQPNPFFDNRLGALEITAISTILTSVQQTLAYALSTLASDLSKQWHQDITAALRKHKTRPEGGASLGFGSLADAVAAAFWSCASVTYGKSTLDSRVFYGLLRGLLREASTEESDMWLVLGQAYMDSSSAIAFVIIQCVTNLYLESPRLDRIRNELSSRLSGVKPSRANSEGLHLVRLLNASAPPPDSDVTFLPPQRTIFMFQAFHKWIESDDDDEIMDEELESQLATISMNCAPILQSLEGAHWDLIMDVTETNLDNASLTTPESLPMLWRTLKLVTEMEELVSSNKALKETWKSRRGGIFSLVKKSLIVSIPSNDTSQPRDECRSLVVSLAAADPTALVDRDSISSLCHLLLDPSLVVQITAHDLLHHAAKPYTENIVLEAEVDVGTDVKPALPEALMEILDYDLLMDSDQDALPYLLAWLISFDLFTDASAKVKNGYLDALRSSSVVDKRLLPLLFTLLNIGASGKSFALDIWAVDDFDVSLFDTESPVALRVLAAHVFYRALITIPSLIRSYHSELKDRQLTGSIGSYTSTYFSPSIIASLLTSIRSPSTLQSLQSEEFKVKVQGSVREIVATYVVDDQSMEIALSIPADYPLKAVEVKDIRRVGVQETKWRTWLLNVNQIVQTGLIVDALFWFRKNVSSFFEGKVECAICYSVISVMDRSLPNKPCKTCKNRFHASCLYKWFNTSHSSSCPLCRSNIM